MTIYTIIKTVTRDKDREPILRYITVDNQADFEMLSSDRWQFTEQLRAGYDQVRPMLDGEIVSLLPYLGIQKHSRRIPSVDSYNFCKSVFMNWKTRTQTPLVMPPDLTIRSPEVVLSLFHDMSAQAVPLESSYSVGIEFQTKTNAEKILSECLDPEKQTPAGSILLKELQEASGKSNAELLAAKVCHTMDTLHVNYDDACTIIALIRNM